MSRKFKEEYDYSDVCDVFALAKCMLRQIDYYLENENLSEINEQFLEKSKSAVETLLEKYPSISSTTRKISQEQLDFAVNGMMGNAEYENMPKEEYKKVYENSSETLKELKRDFEKISQIEDSIHELITVPLWKRTVTSIDEDIKPGDKFAYIVHSGTGIICLPGLPGYKKTRNQDGDYISASLLTNEQMAMFRGSKVGLILKANDAIISGTIADSGTIITPIQSVRTIFDFQNGKYIQAGFPGNIDHEGYEITTKIQSPNQLIEETIKRQKSRGNILSNKSEDVNEVVLDESKVEVIGVFFKTNGCEINFMDFERAVIMQEAYNVPLKIVNSALYRQQMGLSRYGAEDYEGYVKDVEFWSNSENLKELLKNPEDDRKLIKRYFNEVVVGQNYERAIKEKLEDVFTRLIEYTYTCGKKDVPDESEQPRVPDWE